MTKEIGYTFTLGAQVLPQFKGAMTSVKGQLAEITQAVQTMQKSDIGTLGQKFIFQKASIKSYGSELKKAEAELARLKTEAKLAGNQSKVFERQIKLAEQRVKSLDSSLKQNITSYKNHTAAIKTTVGSVSTLGKQYRTLATDIDKARRKQDQLSGNLARKDALNTQRGNLNSSLTTGLSAAAGLAVGPVLAIGFEDAMAKVGALANATNTELERMTQTARMLGRDTVFTASEAAEGMSYLAMAGFNAEENMAAMPGMLALAAAGSTDLGRTADIASNILSGFKIEASDMGIAADILAKTFTSSNTTLEMLGDTMKYVAPVASAVGVSMSEAAAMTGLLGNVGIQGSQAGTAMRTALLRLAAPPKMAREALAELTGATGEELDELMETMEDTAESSEALKSLGIETKDENGNLRELASILEDINEGTANMGTGDKAEVFKKVFGNEASSAMIELASQAGTIVVDEMGNATTALRLYMRQVEQSSGTSARISAQMNNTAGGDLRKMKSAFEDVGIELGNVFIPVIRGTAAAMTSVANGISCFLQKFPNLSSVIIGAGSAVLGFTLGSVVLGYAWNTVATGLNIARRAILLVTGTQNIATIATKAYTAAQVMLNTATKAVTVATQFMGKAFKTAFGPIGIVVSLISAAAFAIYENWDKVGPYFWAVWDSVTQPFVWAYNTVIKPVVEMVASAVDYVVDKKDAIVGFGKSAWDFATGWIGDDEEKETAIAAKETSTIGNQALLQDFNPTQPVYTPVIPVTTATQTALPQRSAQAEVDAMLANLSASQPINETHINIDMAFDVQGLDGEEFKRKITEYKTDFEALVKRVVSDMESQQKRVSYAN